MRALPGVGGGDEATTCNAKPSIGRTATEIAIHPHTHVQS